MKRIKRRTQKFSPIKRIPPLNLNAANFSKLETPLKSPYQLNTTELTRISSSRFSIDRGKYIKLRASSLDDRLSGLNSKLIVANSQTKQKDRYLDHISKLARKAVKYRGEYENRIEEKIITRLENQKKIKELQMLIQQRRAKQLSNLSESKERIVKAKKQAKADVQRCLEIERLDAIIHREKRIADEIYQKTAKNIIKNLIDHRKIVIESPQTLQYEKQRLIMCKLERLQNFKEEVEKADRLIEEYQQVYDFLKLKKKRKRGKFYLPSKRKASVDNIFSKKRKKRKSKSRNHRSKFSFLSIKTSSSGDNIEYIDQNPSIRDSNNQSTNAGNTDRFIYFDD